MKTLPILRSLFAVLLSLAFAQMGWGQTTILSTQAGGGALPTGWTGTNNVTGEAIDRTSYWLVQSSSSTPKDLITSNSIDLSGFSSITVNVNVATHSGQTTNQRLFVELSTNGGSTYSNSLTSAQPTASSPYITGGPITFPGPFTATTRLRFSNNATSLGVRIQQLGITGVLATPAITLANNGTQVTASNVPAGTTNVILHQSSLAVTTANANLTAVSFVTAGTYSSTDVVNFKVWYSADNAFSSGTDTVLGTISSSLGAGAKSLTGLSRSISTGSTGYIFITSDIAASPTGGATLNINALTTANFTFTADTKSGSTTAGGAKTLQVATPSGTIILGGSVSARSTTYGTASTAASFNVEGTGLSGNLTVTSPPGFETSLTEGSGYGATTNITASGTLASTPVWVRLAASTAPGSYSGNITVSGGGASSQNLAIPASTVSTKELTFTGAAVTTKPYDTTTAATITGSLNGIVSPDVVTFTGTGTFASATPGTGIGVTAGIVLTGANAARYTLAQPTGLSGEITKASQTITFAALPAKLTTDADFALTATASSGLAVSYMSSNTAVATVAGNTVTIVGVGSTTITASQAGDTNYDPATNVQQVQSVTTGPTVLALGDISVIGFNSNNPDGFAFVTWVDLNPNTVIKFTDNGFLATASATATNNGRGGENFATWSNTTGNTIPAGTVVTLVDPSSSSQGSFVQSLNGISNSGDQIFAYQGPGAGTTTSNSDFGTNVNPSTFTGTILFGLNFGSDWLSTGTVTTNNSYRPTQLAAAGTSIALTTSSTTSGQYTGARTGQTLAQFKAAVTNTANWTTATAAGTITLDTTPFTIAQSQTITGLVAAETRLVGAPGYSLAASASSSLAVTYSSSDEAVATISGSTVTITGAGSTTITATQAGNATFAAAPAVTQTLTVLPTTWTLIENFTSLTAGALTGQGGWSNSAGTSGTVGTDPADAGNQVGILQAGEQIQNYKSLAIAGPTQSATLFLRFRLGKIDNVTANNAETNAFMGVSDAPAPSAFSNFRAQFGTNPAFSTTGTSSPFHVVGDLPTPINKYVNQQPTDSLWYHAWAVVNKATGKYSVYLQGGQFASQTLVTEIGTGASAFDFRNGGNLSDVDSLKVYLRSAIAANHQAPLFVDDIYFAAGSNLTPPVTPVHVPLLATGSAGSITRTTATITGNDVTADGSSAITERGVVYSTTANPTIADTKVVVSGTTGTFNANLTGLAMNTPYFVRAFATNAIGTAYGADVSFTTLANSLPIFSGMSVGSVKGSAVDILLTKILAKSSDADADTVTIAGVTTPTAGGGTVILGATAITYTPEANFSGSDTITFTLGDGIGTVIHTIAVTVTEDPLFTSAANGPTITPLGGGAQRIAFFGIPGRTYAIQRSTTMASGSWEQIAAVTAAANSTVTFDDPTPPQPSAFYRIAFPAQ